MRVGHKIFHRHKTLEEKDVRLAKSMQIGAIAAGALALAGTAGAANIQLGTYQLHDHPDGNAQPPAYGLRLDGLRTGAASDIFTFSFDTNGADMKLTYDGSSIHIFGTAWGGLDTGSGWVDPVLVEIDFTYTDPSPASGDDDIVAGASDANVGTIVWDSGGSDEQTYHLNDFAGGHPFAFRFGDENDDDGHRGHDGISGWGWLNHGADPLPGDHLYSSDWLFTADFQTPITPIPLPAAAWMGLAGLAGVVVARKRRV